MARTRKAGRRTKHVEAVHRAEALVEGVERTREELRAEARRRLGVTGESEVPRPLRETLRTHGVGWYPLAALGVLSIVDTFQAYAFSVLTPEISRALGVGKGAIAGVIALKGLAISVAPLPGAALVQRHARRAALTLIAAFVWSAVTLQTGFVVTIWGLMLVLVVDGLSTGLVSTLHNPLLLDSYPPAGRVRALSYYQAMNAFGNILGPLAVAVLAASLGFTWRGVFIAMGIASLAGAVYALRLRDPGFGRWDTQEIRRTVREHHHDSHEVAADDVTLGFFEIVRRLVLIPTVRRLLLGSTIFGMLLIPYQTFVQFFLDERWNLGPGARGLFTAFLAAIAIVALAVFGRRGEAMFRADPGRVLRLGSLSIAGAVILIAMAGMSPWFWPMVTLFALSSAFVAVLTPAIAISILSVIPSNMRPHASALIGIFQFGVGGFVGAIFLSGIDRRYGIVGSMVSLMIPGVAGALIYASAGELVRSDLDRMIDETLEDEEIRRLTTSGAHLPMLACRNINFSYGQIQVLFDVNFTVDDGEMVALLGTNGAGKSTLLKVISGIGLPSGGSVRFRGADITFLDAERRLKLGIAQVPGGRAVFAPMTVVQNLRAFGYTLANAGRSDRRSVDEAIERSFEAFPRLGERRNQKASTLSGGEQQMLGLSKALVLEPRMLLIDELSLGLAPVIVEQLLAMVRRINAEGTAVVLVEQSVNVALGLVEHAYFMEKGEIRFDGTARDLLRRKDLLRAVFLEGAGRRAQRQ